MERGDELVRYRLDRVDKEIVEVRVEVASVKKDIVDVREAIADLDQRIATRFSAIDNRTIVQMGATILTLITACVGLLVSFLNNRLLHP